MTDPAHVHALVFGLERYDYGSAMDLPGSARDAVRFARWVLENGVPAEQVWVGLSRLDEQEPESAPPDGVRTVGTTRDAVRRVFTEELAKHQGELLLVFWSGHGMVTTDRDRVLFTSDATPTSRLNVAVENLLTHLASTAVNFARTIVIIDGCATYLWTQGLSGRLPTETWDMPDERSGAQTQDVLLAAAQGQTAATNRTERYGEFAKAVLDTLAPPDAPPMGLPPELDAVWAAVQEAMDTLRDSKQKAQTPVRFERQHNRDNIFSATVGASPPIFNVPGPRASLFVGRQYELDWLADRFGEGRSVPSQPVTVVITGLGGVGKTRLAVEYAYRCADRYKVVWWLRGQQRETAMADLAALVTEIGTYAPGVMDEVEQAALVGRRWLERREYWLLVLDNVESLSDVRHLLPLKGSGDVLVTARSPVEWAELAEVLPVGVLDEVSAARLLLERTGDGDEGVARELARALGCLALALQQAAGYVSESGLSMRRYLELYGTRSSQLLARGRPQDRDDTVATTWALSLERMAKSEPAAVALLKLSAFMASEDLPIELLLANAELPDVQLAKVVDPIGRADALAALRRFGLASVVADRLSVHRVLQTVIRDGLLSEERQRISGLAVEVLAEAFPADVWHSPESWPTAKLLVSHVLAATGHSENLGVAPERTSWLLDRAGTYLHVIGQYNDALPLLTRALNVIEQSLGTDHIDAADRRNHLGELLRDLGKNEEARLHFEQALNMSEVLLDPSNPKIAAVRNNLGRAMLAQGHIEEAHEQLAVALTIAQDAFGSADPLVGSYRNDLGAVLRERGELAAARREFEQALAISEAALGPDHPQVATRRSNLGRLLESLGELPAARDELEKALAISKAALGADHPQVAKRHNDLGMIFRSLGELELARAQLERAVDVSVRTLGPEHPSSIQYRGNLGLLGRGGGSY